MKISRLSSSAGHTVLSQWCRSACACMLAAVAALACSDAPGSTESAPEPAGPAPFVASVASLVGASQPLVYVSLPPGAIAVSGEATLRVLRTGSTATVQVREGGFDPVVVSAAEGDTVAITIRAADGSSPASFRVVVPRPSRPIVIRTSPSKQKRDVPLNTSVTIVFSEPIAPATLNGRSVQLRKGSVVVAGRLAFSDTTGIIAEFVPDQTLASATVYQLVITQGIRDLDGLSLAEPVLIPFTTGTDAAPSLFIVSRPFLGSFNPNDPQADSAAFVSLPRGSISDGTWPLIRNARTGSDTPVPRMYDGGFNPVAVPARAGDVLTITVRSTGGGSALSFRVTVPSNSSPTVVHTFPSQQQSNVPLDAAVEIVFSEPIRDSALVENQGSAAALVQLRQAGGTIDAAQWIGGPSGAPLWIWFLPKAPLTAGMEYELVANGLTSLGGEALAPVSLRFTTESPPPGPPAAVLAVSSFSMIEFQDPAQPGRWHYAPQIRVTETAGRSAATITRMMFTLPGLGNPFPLCSPGTLVQPGESESLFVELNGDYEIVFDYNDGVRASAGDATAAIIYRDNAGRTDTLTVRGPVTAGNLPSTNTGGNGHSYFTPILPTTCQRLGP